MDEKLVRKFLKLYLTRCTFKHAFAFLQHRQICANDRIFRLVNTFNARKNRWLKILDKVKYDPALVLSEIATEWQEPDSVPIKKMKKLRPHLMLSKTHSAAE